MLQVLCPLWPVVILRVPVLLVFPSHDIIGYDPTGTLYTDLSAATAATINSIRAAFQVQKLLERDARGGTRYTEIIRSHFGVVSPDAPLQRAEYLGGGSSPIVVTPVPIVTGKQIGRAHV